MNCTESLAGQMSQLSLQEDPCSTIKTMISIHQELIAALQQANAGAGQGDSAGSVLSEFQRITGCRRTEALFYLKQSNNDVRWVSFDLQCMYHATVRATSLCSIGVSSAASWRLVLHLSGQPDGACS